jgi:N-acetylglutamate synthase-like GNAT family acetyltransferase
MKLSIGFLIFNIFLLFFISHDQSLILILSYELQVEPNCRNSGLGKCMMEILESLCEKLELEKVMLTCSKFNNIGQKFFKEKMKFLTTCF